MAQINRRDAEALFQENQAHTFFKYGYRLVLFFQDIDPKGLKPLIHPKTHAQILDWQKNPLTGLGAVFHNPKDKCLQAIPLVNEQGDRLDNCMIFALGDDEELASKLSYDIISGVLSLLPAHNADRIEAIARLGGHICRDVYNSDRAWYKANTNPLDESGDFSFVEGRGTAAQALFIKGDVVINTGTTATPQRFENGAVLIKQGQDYHGCALDAFKTLYRAKDATGIHPIDPTFFDSGIDLITPADEVQLVADTAIEVTA